MKIVFIGKKYILKEQLPKNFLGDYCVTDKTHRKEQLLFKILANNEMWEISSDNSVKVIYPEDLEIRNELTEAKIEALAEDRIRLEENQFYYVYLNKLKEFFILYCFPDYDTSFLHIDIFNTKEIFIGSGKNNDIICENSLLSDVHAKIFMENGKWTIENYDRNFGLFVNDFPVYNKLKNLFNGDVVFIMGIKIIFMENSFYINNPHNEITFSKRHLRPSIIKNTRFKETNVDDDELDQFTIPKKEKYYSRSPKMEDIIKREKMQIDEPPQMQENQQRPMIFTIGSTLSLGALTIVSMLSTIQGIANGTTTSIELIGSIIYIITMILAMIIIPILEIKWDKNNQKKYEQKRQERYKDYLNKKNDIIEKIKYKQRKILYEKYVSADECAKMISTNGPRLWERRSDDEDFLTVRVGIGEVPLNLEISYPREKFAMADDNLLNLLNNIVDNANIIKDSPVTVSFAKNTTSAIIVKDDDISKKIMKNLILQLIAFHGYEDLKLVFLLNKNQSKDWKYVKMLPHVWDDAKQIRFFADNVEDMNEISRYLEEELKNRMQKEENNNGYNKYPTPYYLVITDDYTQTENLEFIIDFLKLNKNFGFSLLCITDDLYQLPSSCKLFIDVKDKTKGFVYDNKNSSENRTEIRIEPLSAFFFEKIAQKLANINLRIKKKGVTSLPNNYTFLDMYNVGKIEQLDILNRWRRNDSTQSLKAPIGIDSNGVIINLDAHEKYHGPHGLIAGATGSGKSEFIITYILSLAINYHPDDVTFLLIDYKGGGLAGAFEKNNMRLPHLVGIITNIDKDGLNRSLTSIQSELRRRQIMFNEARNITEEGTIDIYKYQKLYHDGVVKEAIPHLFIICDEFAELKQQQEEFMDELISVSRIGRSLGVHLILATQKPAGIVNDQIRSNSKFAICLKVQDISDSSDVILRPDAAYLKNAGQFYFKVGQNEYFVLGQSGWSGAPYIPSKILKKRTDSSIEFISNIGTTIKRMDDTKKQAKVAHGEQLTNIFRYICDTAEKEKIRANNLWLEDISEDIYVKDLRKKYHIKVKENNIDVVIGEYDDPSNQKQGPAIIECMKKDNILICGNAKSGKETLLSTFIYELITTYTTEQVWIYILDFGSEALKIYKNSSHVGDVVLIGEEDRIERFFEMIRKEILTRKEILSICNGDYNTYISKGNKLPLITIIINNYEAFQEIYGDKYEDLFLTETREGLKTGIIFVVTSSSVNDMRYRLGQNFNKKIALQLNNDDEYYMMFENAGRKKPSNVFGRGLIKINGDDIFEFQTAKICKHIEYNEHIEKAIEKINKQSEIIAKAIPSMPKVIGLQYVKDYLKNISTVPIGINKIDLGIYTYDFSKNFTTVISSRDIDDSIQFLSFILKEVESLDNVCINILEENKDEDKLREEYNEFISVIESNLDEENEKFCLCAIIGIDDFAVSGILDEEEFNELMEKANSTGRFSFIIVEKPSKLEEHTYDEWYKNYINQTNGIWIGNGIDNQTLISTNYSSEGYDNNCGRNFGYIINGGDGTLIKLVGMREEGEKYE